MYRLIITENWLDDYSEGISISLKTYKDATKKATDFIEQGYHAVIFKEE